MREMTIALAAIIMTIFLMVPLAQVGIVEAIYPYSYIYFYSPRPPDEMIYQNTTLPITIEIEVRNDSPEIATICYSLDGTANKGLTWVKMSNTEYSARGTLANLSEGNHTLIVYGLDVHGGVVISESETFAVNKTFTYPTIRMISPLNQTYTKNEVPLIYNVDAQVKYAYYILDSFNERSFQGNTTLTELSEGQHTIHLSALTEWNIYAQQTIYFTITTRVFSHFDCYCFYSCCCPSKCWFIGLLQETQN